MTSPTTFTARQVARKVEARTHRPMSDKRVRAWVRENIEAYDDDGYTAHLYAPALAKRIEDALVKRSQGARPTAASSGRAGKVAKVAKPKPVAPDATPDA